MIAFCDGVTVDALATPLSGDETRSEPSVLANPTQGA
jgi:hypothetical protein